MSDMRKRAFALTFEEITALMDANDGQIFLFSSNEATIYLHTVEPGYGVPIHTHEEMDEVCFVLQGSVRFYLAGTLMDIEAGGAVSIGHGAEHAYLGLGNEQSVLRWVAVPSGFDELFNGIEELPAGTSGEKVEALNVIGEKFATYFSGAVPNVD